VARCHSSRASDGPVWREPLDFLGDGAARWRSAELHEAWPPPWRLDSCRGPNVALRGWPGRMAGTPEASVAAGGGRGGSGVGCGVIAGREGTTCHQVSSSL